MIRVRTERTTSNKALALGFLLAALLAAIVLAAARPAQASTTFTVNSTGDGADINLADSACDASSAAGLQCTLRAAIQEANDTSGADTINFNISGGGVKTIVPTSELPRITDQVTIDGYSQPGASPNTQAQGNDAVLLIELNGEGAGQFANGLTIDAVNSVVRGLVINRFNQQGIEIVGLSATGNKVEGNFIGTDASGTQELGNNINGVLISDASNNTVGGTTPDKRNVISGNGVHGVLIAGSGATGNKVEGNYIGTNKDRTKTPNNLGNSFGGVRINSASGNTVGGAASGAANTIAFNGFDGIAIEEFAGSGAPTGNRILSNSIFSNGRLGINLVGGEENQNGVTKNDKKDRDTGPNDLQNFPVLTRATLKGTTTRIKGTLNSTPNTTFTIQFFSNPKKDPSGFGEGKSFLGEKTDVTTDGDGNATFTFVPPQVVSEGQLITAAATNDLTGDTSEFSAPREVVLP